MQTRRRNETGPRPFPARDHYAALAIAFARAGHDVAVNYRADAEAAAETVALCEAEGAHARAIASDVADPAAVSALFATCDAELGRVSCLINNAGIIGGASPLAEVAVETLTIGAGKELGPLGIRVAAIRVGTTATDLHAREGNPDRPAAVARQTPLGRVGQPEDIAEAALWLASPGARFVSGTVLTVAGGLVP